jgi:hypothetical protein
LVFDSYANLATTRSRRVSFGRLQLAELVAVVLAGLAGGVDPWWWGEDWPLMWIEGDAPSGVVHDVVMRGAQ